ncbi:MAG: 4Fe-4S dicluster domain-containing protein [Patescibacteria group bacterium]
MKLPLSVKPGTTSKVKTGNWRPLEYPEIDHEKCIGCAMCERACPEGICFSTGLKNKSGKTFFEKDLDYCKGCGLCEHVCPVQAIIMKEEKK